jgi:hypothetical protein
MSPAVDIALIAVGLILIGGSRTFADAFKIRGDTSAITKFSGLGDNYNSRLYRWATAVGTGVVFIAVGTAGLVY